MNRTNSAIIRGTNTMQAKKAQRLREAWGDRPCDHPEYDREIVFGCDSGDKVCTQCGETLSDEEIEKIRRKRQGR